MSAKHSTVDRLPAFLRLLRHGLEGLPARQRLLRCRRDNREAGSRGRAADVHVRLSRLQPFAVHREGIGTWCRAGAIPETHRNRRVPAPPGASARATIRRYLERLRRDFPGESFLLVRYGDRQPAFQTIIIDPTLDKEATAKRILAFDPRYLTTYYAIDVINYQPVDLTPALDLLDAPLHSSRDPRGWPGCRSAHRSSEQKPNLSALFRHLLRLRRRR